MRWKVLQHSCRLRQDKNVYLVSFSEVPMKQRETRRQLNYETFAIR